MAYLNLLMSVPTSELNALCEDSSYTAKYTELTAVSHLLAYWIKIQPLGELLGTAIDGGELINDELWHPLRKPAFHSSEDVVKLHEQIAAEWNRIPADKQTTEPFDYFGPEIEKLLSVFKRAATNGECIVSILEPPADKERADRVKFPFEHVADIKAGSRVSPLWFVGGGVVSVAIGICAWRYRRFAKKTMLAQAVRTMYNRQKRKPNINHKKTPDNNTMHTEPRAARLFLLARLSPRPGER